MFCSQCGAQMQEGARFCSQCGFSYVGDEQKRETVIEDQEIFDRALDFSEQFLELPDIPNRILSDPLAFPLQWRVDFIDGIDPVKKLQYFKNDLLNFLTKEFRSKVDAERMQGLVEQIYPKCYRKALKNQRKWFFDRLEKFYSHQKFKDKPLIYSTVWGLDEEVTFFLVSIKGVFEISRALQDEETLRAAIRHLELVEKIRYQAGAGEIYRSGLMLKLPQFRAITNYYYKLKESIQDAVVALSPDAKEEVEKEKKARRKEREKEAATNQASVAVRVLVPLLSPLAFLLEYLFMPALREKGALAAFIASIILLFGIIIACIFIRKPIAVFVLAGLALALFFPIAAFVSWLISILKMAALIILAIFVLGCLGTGAAFASGDVIFIHKV